MARQQTKRNVKNNRTPKIVQHLADIKHFGDEPNVNGKKLEGLELLKVLNWYNYMCTKAEAREYIESYLDISNRKKELKLHRKVHDNYVNLQSGWLARILMRGGIVSKEKLDKLINQTLQTLEQEETNTTNNIKQLYSKEWDYISEISEYIDAHGYTLNCYEWLVKNQVASTNSKKIRDYFKPVYNEICDVLQNNCDQLKQAYRHYNKQQLNQIKEFYSNLIKDCDRYSDSNTKQRKARKKKPITVEKKLKNFKYQQESKEFKVVSINSEKIIGSTELWVFNTKYKTITVYRASDGKKLDVNNVSVINYCPENSFTYRTGRKTEQIIDIVLNNPKKYVEKQTKDLTKSMFQQRSSETTILLRAM